MLCVSFGQNSMVVVVLRRNQNTNEWFCFCCNKHYGRCSVVHEQNVTIFSDIQNLLLIRVNLDWPPFGTQGAHYCHRKGCGIHAWWISPDLNLLMKKCHWSILYTPDTELGYTYSLSCVCISHMGQRCYPPAYRVLQISF